MNLGRRTAAVILVHLFSISALVGLPARAVPAADTGVVETDEVLVRYDGALGTAAKEVARRVPKIRRDMETRLGWELGYRPEVILLKDRDTFRQTGAGGSVVAFAVPRRGLIVIDYSRLRTDPFGLEPILAHELVHLILHHHIPETLIPRWLDEGVAQWAGGGAAEIPLMEDVGPRLVQAVLAGRWVPFRDLAVGFPAEDPDLSLAYEQSRSMVDYLAGRGGTEGFQRFLALLKNGRRIDEAVEEAFSVSFGELEAGWRGSLKRRVSWTAYLSNRLPVFLFVFGALLTVLGFVRFLIRKRNDKDGEGNGEEERPGEGSEGRS